MTSSMTVTEGAGPRSAPLQNWKIELMGEKNENTPTPWNPLAVKRSCGSTLSLASPLAPAFFCPYLASCSLP